jgi:hypothetical protein
MALTTIEWHRIILGTEPTAEQMRLYNAYPEYKGISDRAQDPDMAKSAILLALRSGTGTDQVLVLAPQAQEDWLLKQCETVAITCFESCKKYPTRAKDLIKGYTRLFQKLKMTGRLLQLEEEPPHWVSFGFSVDDALPPWMPGKLLAL